MPYRSQKPGRMHACGHDAHMAMLLGGGYLIRPRPPASGPSHASADLPAAARLLKEHEAELRGSVKLLFQPAGALCTCQCFAAALQLPSTPWFCHLPAEEGGGGGKQLVDEGWLKGVAAVFGMHVWPEYSSGVVGIKVTLHGPPPPRARV